MEANTRKFLLTFKQESEPETVLVTGATEPKVFETFDFSAEEKELEDEPW